MSTDGGPAEQHPAVRDYSLLCMGALTLMVAALVLRLPDPWVLLPAFLGALGLLFRWRLGPVIVLLAVTLVLWSWWLGTNPGWMGLATVASLRRWLLGWRWGFVRLPLTQAPSRGPRPLSDLLLAISLLAYAVGQYRLQGLLVRLFPPESRRRPPDKSEAQTADEAVRRSPDHVTPGEYAVLLLALPACGVLAALFWAWLQRQDTALEIDRSAWQGILVLWLLGGGVLVAAALLRYLALRRQTPTEATLYLQDVVWRETRREQRRLNRWLAWAWLRRRRREEEAS
jgi:hypothetical protein